MLLSDSAILDGVRAGTIYISPFDANQLGPNSYDLRLGSRLLRYATPDGVLDPRRINATQEITIPTNGIRLEPGRLYLGETVETAGSTVYAPMVEGRSSYGRLGLDVHISAGFGDVGFVGVWTLELRVVEPFILYPNERICQIYFHRVEGAVLNPYKGKYVNSTRVTASKLHTELNNQV